MAPFLLAPSPVHITVFILRQFQSLSLPAAANAVTPDSPYCSLIKATHCLALLSNKPGSFYTMFVPRNSAKPKLDNRIKNCLELSVLSNRFLLFLSKQHHKRDHLWFWVLWKLYMEQAIIWQIISVVSLCLSELISICTTPSPLLPGVIISTFDLRA